MAIPFDPIQSIRDVQHFGEEGGVVPVIDHAATSTFLNPKDMERVFHGELEGCYLYSRHSNPSVMAFGKKIAAMDNMEAGFGVASGMSAIACVVEQILLDGGHVISSNTIYGGTYALFANIFPRRGIQVSFVDPTDSRAIEEAIRPDTKLIYTETMSNPLLGISNLSEIGKISKKHGVKFVVDNTFTPMIITPSLYGADVVVYSCTKYISGSSDLIAGAVVCTKEFLNELIDVNTGLIMLHGPVMDPRIAYELYSRMDHLHLRMKAHCENAQFFAQALADKNISVVYPGLPNHPDKQLFKLLANPGFGAGGMVTIDCGSTEKASQLASLLQKEKFGLFAVSLGFTRTLMSCPAASTSSEIPEGEREKIGLKPGLLRLSLGVTGNNQVMLERFLRCYQRLSPNSHL